MQHWCSMQISQSPWQLCSYSIWQFYEATITYERSFRSSAVIIDATTISIDAAAKDMEINIYRHTLSRRSSSKNDSLRVQISSIPLPWHSASARAKVVMRDMIRTGQLIGLEASSPSMLRTTAMRVHTRVRE
jgi:hypothetical protein